MFLTLGKEELSAVGDENDTIPIATISFNALALIRIKTKKHLAKYISLNYPRDSLSLKKHNWFSLVLKLGESTVVSDSSCMESSGDGPTCWHIKGKDGRVEPTAL